MRIFKETGSFRCIMCGKFKKHGVMESDPEDPSKLCLDCVREASELLDETPLAEARRVAEELCGTDEDEALLPWNSGLAPVVDACEADAKTPEG